MSASLATSDKIKREKKISFCFFSPVFGPCRPAPCLLWQGVEAGGNEGGEDKEGDKQGEE